MDQQNHGTPIPATPSFQIPSYVLDDLCSRFIINIPEEERQDLVRIFFQIELAHWFYLDFYCAETPELRACGIKDFSAQEHCAFLSDYADDVDKRLADWKSYKMSVPTYGAIMLDSQMKYVLEETGFDITDLIDKNEYLENQMNDQLTRLYIVPGVPMDTKFQPKTRKEIKSLQWYAIDMLPLHKRDQTPKTQLGMNPNCFFMVIPFVKSLRKWIAGKRDRTGQDHRQDLVDEIGAGDQKPKSKQNKKQDIESKQITDKQRLKQQQFFAQQNQNEFQEFLKFKDPKLIPQRNDGHNAKGRQPVFPAEGNGGSPRMNRKQLQILNRDGSVSGTVRRSLNNQLANSDGDKKAKSKSPIHHQKVKITEEFGSEAWLNFKFDVAAIMACLPQ